MVSHQKNSECCFEAQKPGQTQSISPLKVALPMELASSAAVPVLPCQDARRFLQQRHESGPIMVSVHRAPALHDARPELDRPAWHLHTGSVRHLEEPVRGDDSLRRVRNLSVWVLFGRSGTLSWSFSAVSTPIFAIKNSLESSKALNEIELVGNEKQSACNCKTSGVMREMRKP